MFLKLNQWVIYLNNKKRIGIFVVSRKSAALQSLKLFSLRLCAKKNRIEIKLLWKPTSLYYSA